MTNAKIQSENISAIKFSHNIVDENKTILHTITTDETRIPDPELFKRKWLDNGFLIFQVSATVSALRNNFKLFHIYLKIC